MGKYKAGVLHGAELEALYNDAKDNQFALPAVNCIGTDTINGVLESAEKVNSPVIIQFSNGGAQFLAGKGMPNDKLQANISGGISGALHIHNVAKHYGVPVVLHTDHAAKKWLPWISGLIDAGEQFYKEKGQPLFSSHMLDLSEEPIEEKIPAFQGLFADGGYAKIIENLPNELTIYIPLFDYNDNPASDTEVSERVNDVKDLHRCRKSCKPTYRQTRPTRIINVESL